MLLTLPVIDKIIALSWDGKASGEISPDGLNLNPAWFAYVGYSHHWSRQLNSTISTNWTGTDLSSLQSDDTIQKAGTLHGVPVGSARKQGRGARYCLSDSVYDEI